MADEWTTQLRPMWFLFRNGEPILDGDTGRPKAYDSEAEAIHVADNWDSYRAPTFAELKGMSDEELRSRALGG